MNMHEIKTDMQVINFQAVNTYISNDTLDGVKVLRVVKDPKVEAFDEPTFALLGGSNFTNGVIEVSVYSRLLEDAPDADMGLNEWIDIKIVVAGEQAKLFLNDGKQPVLIVNDLKHGPDVSGAVGLWVVVGTEGFFHGLRIIQM
jgi:hypothetical protein